MNNKKIVYRAYKDGELYDENDDKESMIKWLKSCFPKTYVFEVREIQITESEISKVEVKGEKEEDKPVVRIDPRFNVKRFNTNK